MYYSDGLADTMKRPLPSTNPELIQNQAKEKLATLKNARQLTFVLPKGAMTECRFNVTVVDDVITVQVEGSRPMDGIDQQLQKLLHDGLVEALRGRKNGLAVASKCGDLHAMMAVWLQPESETLAKERLATEVGQIIEPTFDLLVEYSRRWTRYADEAVEQLNNAPPPSKSVVARYY